MTGSVNSCSSQSRAARTSSTSPMPFACSPSLRPVPRKLKRSTGNPKLLSAFMAWKTTLLWSVPPKSGCGWQTTAACVALGDPALRSASRRPAGPVRNKERMLDVSGSTESEYNSAQWSAGRPRPPRRSTVNSALSTNRDGLLRFFCMDLFALARRLIDIESIIPNENAVGDFLCDELQRRGMEARKNPVEGPRANVLATWPEHAHPETVFSTHMDTVPPFIASSEDDGRIYGRGACDAKGIIAAQILAAEKLRGAGVFAGLLFLVGEERDSIGAKAADQQPIGARFMINGEPTENKLALASKGALHVELVARGKMAHSAYPELGESAIDKLVEALHRLHAMNLPKDADVGPCTKNVGSIQGGRAPNVIPDYAKADLFYRLVGPTDTLRREITEAVGELPEVRFTRETPFLRLRAAQGLAPM